MQTPFISSCFKNEVLFRVVPDWTVPRHPQIHVYQVAQNVTLFRNRFFVDVTKLRWSHTRLEWALNLVTSVLRRRRRCEDAQKHRDTQARRPCKEGRDWSDTDTSQSCNDCQQSPEARRDTEQTLLQSPQKEATLSPPWHWTSRL